MERLKKLKKEKSFKCSSKDQGPLLIADLKSFKENIKIKEILRNVKMNSSMRLKAPPGNKVMSNADFNEEDCFAQSSVTEDSTQILSATNPDVVFSNAEHTEVQSDNDNNNKIVIQESETGNESDVVAEVNACNSTMESLCTKQPDNSSQDSCDKNQNDTLISNTNTSIPNGRTNDKSRDRKLSLDHAILTRREGLSQSELDLHSIGKSPLERKSSFFRKTMDSFVRNTTEMFKKQNKCLQRHVSMSVSLQSLNDKSLASNDNHGIPTQQIKDGSEDRRTYLQMPPQIVRSHSSMIQIPSSEQSVAVSYAGSQPTLETPHSCSAHSLNEAYLKDSMPTRAISMSSGLNSPLGHPRRKTPRANRVTWLASEGLTNYLRRIVQDEKSQEMQSCQSYQDFTCIPENEKYSRKTDTKGRRLSYQRAVSGEDPVMPMRHHQDSTLRRKDQIPEMFETRETSQYLADYTRHGVPPLPGFEMAPIPEMAKVYIIWASGKNSFQDYLAGKTFTRRELARIEVIKELIKSEADHINHLTTIIEVFVGAANALQKNGKMLKIDTKKLFANITDVLNASLCFWNISFLPMIKKAIELQEPFDTNLMYEGFQRCQDILSPYEAYLMGQSNLLEYYKANINDSDFSLYLNWCYNHHDSHRLHLDDFLAKPLQRLTRYTLLLRRIREHTDAPYDCLLLETMEHSMSKYLQNVNLSVRKKEEIAKVNRVQSLLEPHDSDLKDDDIYRMFKMYASIDLTRPMLYCRPGHMRCVIHEANLRFRDGNKEIEVRAILFTDMIMICKSVLIKRKHRYKLLRSIYMIDKLVQLPKFRNNNDIMAIMYLVVDDLGSTTKSFIVTDSFKESNNDSLKIWENKVKEAKLTYESLIWTAQNPNKKITREELDHIIDFLQIRARSDADEKIIEHEASQRVAAVVHESNGSKDYNPLQYISDAPTEVVVGVAARLPRLQQRNHIIVQRTLPIMKAAETPDSEFLTPRTLDNEGSQSSGLRRNTFLERFVVQPSSYEGPPSVPVRVVDGVVQYGGVSAAGTPDPEHRNVEDGGDEARCLGAQGGTVQSAEASSTDSSPQPRRGQNNVATIIYSIPRVTISPSTPNSEKKSPTTPEVFPFPPVRKLTKMDHVRSQSPVERTVSPTRKADRAGSPQPGSSTDYDNPSKLTKPEPNKPGSSGRPPFYPSTHSRGSSHLKSPQR